MTEILDLPRASEQRLHRSAEASSPSPTLPPELLADAARRLGWLGLLYAAGGLFGYFGRRALLALAGAAAFEFRASDIVTLVGIAMGIAVFLVARSRRLPPQRLLDLGLVFQVAGAFSMAFGPMVDAPARAPDLSFASIPTECAWI